MAADVFRLIKKRDATIDATLDKVKSTYDRINARLSEYIRANQGVKALSLADARRDLERILTQSGLYEAVGTAREYDNYLKSAQEVYKSAYGDKFTYSPVTRAEMGTLRDAAFAQFDSLTTSARDNLANMVFQIRVGGMSIEEAQAALRREVGRGLARHVNTWIETSRSSYSNTALVTLAADNGITKYEYVGPMDAITRPFCADHIGEILTIEEWDKLDNGQINPVSVYRGGYNCRHILLGIPEGAEGFTPPENEKEAAAPESEKETPPPTVTPPPAPVAESFTDQINAISGNRNIEKFMAEKMGIAASIGRADSELIKGFAVEVDRMNRKYRFAEVKKIFTKQAASNEIARAGQSGGVNAIQLTRGNVQNIDDFIEIMGRNVDSGQFPKIDKSKYKSFVLTHEIGHLIRDGMVSAGMKSEILEIDAIANNYTSLYETSKARAMGIVFRENKANPLQGNALDRAIRSETRKQMGDNFLSHYAGTDKYEFFSEALAEIENNSGTLSPFAARLKKIIDESTLLKGE